MKICYLADAKSIHVQKWASYFSNRNHEVHILSFRNGSVPGATVHCLPSPFEMTVIRKTSPFGKLGYLLYLRKARATILKIVPDILHAHWATSYGLLGACSRYHPFVLSAWGRDIMDFPNYSIIHKKLLINILKNADSITATSAVLTAETKKYMPDRTPIQTIPFGVDLTVFKSKVKNKKKNITIGIVKSLEKKYGIEYLIKAFAVVYKSYPDILLLIIGEGSLKKQLIQLCRQLKIEERVLFTGFIENMRVPDFINKMDIFVIPSISASETFGVAAVEAAACQVPVIASEIGGLPEVVIDKKTGFLVPPRNPQAIADKIIQLLKDLKLRERMGKDARKWVQQKFDWIHNGHEMECLYQSIINNQTSVRKTNQCLN
jgi:glycosyltransferase involved in cell wall biosynthesis